MLNQDDLLFMTPLGPYICSQKPLFIKAKGQPRGLNPKGADTTYYWKKPNDFFCEQVILRGLLGKTMTVRDWVQEFTHIERCNPGYGTRGGDSGHITARMNVNAMVVEGLLQKI